MAKNNADIKAALFGVEEAINLTVIEGISKAAHKLLREIFNDRLWSDDTGNLRDSFGFAIFKKGVEVRRGYLEPEQATKPYQPRGKMRAYGLLRGREQLNAALDDYQSRNMDYEVVIVAGMYYAVILEWKNLLAGFINAEDIAKSEVINAIRTTKIPRVR